jgi:hypothetical protein
MVFSGTLVHTLHRMDNTLILSEGLDGDAVQVLIKIAIADLFPERCNRFQATNQEISIAFAQDMEKRRDTARQKITRHEDSLRRVLREAVVEDVIKLFPYVVLDGILRYTLLKHRSLQVIRT